jgi:hypothetical protein
MSIVHAQEQSLRVADYVEVLAETTIRGKRPKLGLEREITPFWRERADRS